MTETLTNQELLLSVVCDEPEGKIKRNVYVMELTPENIRKFWEKARKYKWLFNEQLRGDFNKFLGCFVEQDSAGNITARGLNWVVDDFVGVLNLTNITDSEATAHISFLDGRIRGRKDLAIEMLKYAFVTYGFHRINTATPLFDKLATINFIKSLNFVPEGRKRKCVFYNGEWWDELHFGILKEEFLNGSSA